jgi:hypothetical protein
MGTSVLTRQADRSPSEGDVHAQDYGRNLRIVARLWMQRTGSRRALANSMLSAPTLAPKLVPSAAAGFQKAVTGVTTTETNLISAFQQENQSLLFLSANTYSCGDPNEPTVRRYLGAKDPASLVSNEHINKYWTQSLKYLASYVKLLNVIVGNAQSSVSDIDATVSAGTFAASIIPGIQSPAAGAALKALGAVAKDAANLVAEGYLVGAAQAAARPLAVAVGYLQKYYPAFEGNELLAFNAWDECAHEKLAFIRDNPFGRVPGYPTPFFAPSNGVELDAAYAAWSTQREAYISAGTISKPRQR